MRSRANTCCCFSQSKARLSRRMKISCFFFLVFFCNFFEDQSISPFCRAFCGASVLLELSRILHKHTRTKNNLIITNMSAALTSSTFVGAKVSVAKTTTASKRVAFSVQANASGPKKVRIPISFFFLCA